MMSPANDASAPDSVHAAAGLLLVVDAGGSKTAAWLVDTNQPDSERVLGRGRAAAGNPLSVGFPEAARAIAEAAASATHAAGKPNLRVPRAILSIAGSANHQLRDHFIELAIDANLAQRVAIVSDVLPILAAGTPNCHGIALIAGTGSVAFARAEDGRTTLCGGWGYLLGDEGSGYAVGRAALQFAMHELELNRSRRPLADAVLKELDARTIMDVTKSIYRRADPRKAVASLAPVVITAADDGDNDAQAIVDAAATDLARLLARAAKSIGFADLSFPLAIGGGVLANSRRMPQQLTVELRRLGLSPQMNVVTEPLEGCIRLAGPDCAANLVSWHRC